MNTPPDIPIWTPPWPTQANSDFIRISAAHLRGDEWTCAEQVAAKARPQVRPIRDGSVRRTYPPDADFALGSVHNALIFMLDQGLDRDRALEAVFRNIRENISNPFRTAVERGVDGYLQFLTDLRSSGQLPADSIVRTFIGIDPAPQRIEWYGWGILHISRDSQLREYHLLGQSRVDERERSAASIGVYARIAADPVAVLPDTPWQEPYLPAPAQPRAGATVIIREVGVFDGSHCLRFTGTIDQALEFFNSYVPGALQVLGGGSYAPGSGCATCAVRPECQGLAHLPGVLGVAGVATWPRAFSPSDLHQAQVCTQQVYLGRTLGLPQLGRVPTGPMQRGTRVHAWLELAHGQREACSVDSLGWDQLDPIAEQLGWSLDTYRGLRPYLLAHAAHCPLAAGDPDSALPEVTLTAWDTDVDVIVSTRADLVLHTGDTIVVRETKTVSHDVSTDSDRELLNRYAQVALTICLLADGYDPLAAGVPAITHRTHNAVVEIEFLSEDGFHLRRFEVNDPEIVLLARTAIAGAADTLLYTDPTPSLGTWCSSCGVSSWCEAFQASQDTVTSTLRTPTASTPDDELKAIFIEAAPTPEEEFGF